MQLRLYLDEDARLVPSSGACVLAVSMSSLRPKPANCRLTIPPNSSLRHKTAVFFTPTTSDFYQLHTVWGTQGKSHAGIILVAQSRFTIGEQLRRVLKLAATKSAEDLQNHLEFLSAWS